MEKCRHEEDLYASQSQLNHVSEPNLKRFWLYSSSKMSNNLCVSLLLPTLKVNKVTSQPQNQLIKELKFHLHEIQVWSREKTVINPPKKTYEWHILKRYDWTLIPYSPTFWSMPHIRDNHLLEIGQVDSYIVACSKIYGG